MSWPAQGPRDEPGGRGPASQPSLAVLLFSPREAVGLLFPPPPQGPPRHAPHWVVVVDVSGLKLVHQCPAQEPCWCPGAFLGERGVSVDWVSVEWEGASVVQRSVWGTGSLERPGLPLPFT